MTTVALEITEGSELPAAYVKATPAEVYEMLVLGALIKEVVVTQKSEEDARARAAAYTQDIARVQAAKEADVAALKARYEKDAAAIKAAVEAQAAAERALAAQTQETAKRQQEATVQQLRALEGRLAELTARKTAADADVDAQLARVRAAELAASERILSAKDAELQRLVKDKETAEADRRLYLVRAQALEERLAALTEALHKKPATAKDKGAAFEAAMDELLRQQWGAADGFSIADVSQRGHIGDRLVTLGSGGGGGIQTILLECKDYGDTVPKTEVDKFFKDVSTNHKVTVGLMVSRRTPIQGHSSHSAIEFCVHEGKLCLFVNAFDRLDAASTVAQWLAWIRYWALTQKPSTEVEDKAEAIRTIKELVDKAQADARTLGEHLRHLDELKQFVKRTADETHRRLLEALVGLQRGAEVSASSHGELFKEAPTEGEAEWIAAIRAATEPGLGVKLSDLAERLSTEKIKGERTKGFIEAALHPSAVLRQPGKATMVLGLQLRSLSHA
jgi:hypothetical protein